MEGTPRVFVVCFFRTNNVKTTHILFCFSKPPITHDIVFFLGDVFPSSPHLPLHDDALSEGALALHGVEDGAAGGVAGGAAGVVEGEHGAPHHTSIGPTHESDKTAQATPK